MAPRKKNTKDVAIETYNATLENTKSEKSAVFNPANEIKVKRKIEVTEKAESFINKFDTSKLNENLNSLIIAVQSVIEEYNTTKEAITFAKEELSELYGIKAESESYVALIAAKETVISKYENDMQSKALEWNTKIDSLKKSYDDLNKSEAESRRKNKEEYDYELKRKIKEDNDKLKDEIDSKKKLFMQETEAASLEISNECKALEERRVKLDELSNELAGKEVVISESIEKAVKEAVDKNDSKHQYELRYIKKENENRIALLESQLETCKNQNLELREEVKEVKEKLSGAYDKLENMAAKSIESAGNARQISTLEGLLKKDKNENSK